MELYPSFDARERLYDTLPKLFVMPGSTTTSPSSSSVIDDGRYVVRMVADAADRWRTWGMIGGAIFGGTLAALSSELPSGGRIMMTLVPCVVGWLGARHVGKQRREDTCGSCEKRLPVYEDHCSTCRARIVAEARTVEERMALEDRIDRLGVERALAQRPAAK